MTHLIGGTNLDRNRPLLVKDATVCFHDGCEYLIILCRVSGCFLYKIEEERFVYGQLKFQLKSRYQVESYKSTCIEVVMVNENISGSGIVFLTGTRDGSILLTYKTCLLAHSTSITSIKAIRKQDFHIVLSADIDSRIILSRLNPGCFLQQLYVFVLSPFGGEVALTNISYIDEICFTFICFVKGRNQLFECCCAPYRIIANQSSDEETAVVSSIESYNVHFFSFRNLLPKQSKILYIRDIAVTEAYLVILGITCVELIFIRTLQIVSTLHTRFKAKRLVMFKYGEFIMLGCFVSAFKNLTYMLPSMNLFKENIPKFSIEGLISDTYSPIILSLGSQVLKGVYLCINENGRCYSWLKNDCAPFQIERVNVGSITNRSCSISFVQPPMSSYEMSNSLSMRIYRISQASVQEKQVENSLLKHESIVAEQTQLLYSTCSRFILNSLIPGESFKVALAFQNLYGIGYFSQYSEIFTCKCGVPEVMKQPSCSILSSTSIRVIFNVPFHGGSPITSYVLQYKGGNVPLFSQMAEIEFDMDTGRGTPGEQLSYILNNLEDYCVYNVRISACNAMGRSGFSVPSFSVETLPSKHLSVEN